jgi:hypothetical protein
MPYPMQTCSSKMRDKRVLNTCRAHAVQAGRPTTWFPFPLSRRFPLLPPSHSVSSRHVSAHDRRRTGTTRRNRSYHQNVRCQSVASCTNCVPDRFPVPSCTQCTQTRTRTRTRGVRADLEHQRALEPPGEGAAHGLAGAVQVVEQGQPESSLAPVEQQHALDPPLNWERLANVNHRKQR